jgi:hypothetical protein
VSMSPSAWPISLSVNLAVERRRKRVREGGNCRRTGRRIKQRLLAPLLLLLVEESDETLFRKS